MQTFKEAVASVENAPTSIFAKEDVLHLLKSIQFPKSQPDQTLEVKGRFTKDQVSTFFQVLMDEIKSNIDNLDNDTIDKSSAEFSLNYNEIELDSVDLDTREIERQVTDGLADKLEEFFDENEAVAEEEMEGEEEEEVA